MARGHGRRSNAEADRLVEGARTRLANAGLKVMETWPLANVIDLWAVPQDSYSPSFSLRAVFHDGGISGCLLRPGERPTRDIPLQPAGDQRPLPPPDRTFRIAYDDAAGMAAILDAIVREAAPYAPPARDPELGALDPQEDALLDAMRRSTVREGQAATAERLHAFLVRRARETGDRSLLEEAAEALGEPGAAYSPGPGR